MLNLTKPTNDPLSENVFESINQINITPGKDFTLGVIFKDEFDNFLTVLNEGYVKMNGIFKEENNSNNFSFKYRIIKRFGFDIQQEYLFLWQLFFELTSLRDLHKLTTYIQ